MKVYNFKKGAAMSKRLVHKKLTLKEIKSLKIKWMDRYRGLQKKEA